MSRATPLLCRIAITLAIASCAAQSPGHADKPAAERSFPSPTNLTVLPKNLTGQQVHEVMKEWESELGVRCDACHQEDDVKVNAQGAPLLDFANDSKAMKRIARLMYVMTDEINRKYVANLEGSGIPVTCGTCHRGRVGPEPFAPTPETAVRTPNTMRPSN